MDMADLFDRAAGAPPPEPPGQVRRGCTWTAAVGGCSLVATATVLLVVAVIAVFAYAMVSILELVDPSGGVDPEYRAFDLCDSAAALPAFAEVADRRLDDGSELYDSGLDGGPREIGNTCTWSGGERFAELEMSYTAALVDPERPQAQPHVDLDYDRHVRQLRREVDDDAEEGEVDGLDVAEYLLLVGPDESGGGPIEYAAALRLTHAVVVVHATTAPDVRAGDAQADFHELVRAAAPALEAELQP